jgi:hypothetical protein
MVFAGTSKELYRQFLFYTMVRFLKNIKQIKIAQIKHIIPMKTVNFWG